MKVAVDAARMAGLLRLYHGGLDGEALERLVVYLELLLKWNARTNLTAIREPEEIVRRHFGESLFVAAHLPPGETLLDFGSGAGFPGMPIQIALPELKVTLAESQGKKSSFLLEVVRTLGLSAEVWAGRVEDLPAGRMFDLVTLRAVDRPKVALEEARRRLTRGGTICHLTTGEAGGGGLAIPGIERGVLAFLS